MLAIFLIGTLWLGMRYKKDGRSIMEYTIGDKTFTTAALIATVVATSYGGGELMRIVNMVYDKGMWYIMFTIGGTAIACLSCIVVASRIGIFMSDHIPSKNHISMADTIGRIYGRIPGIITALASVSVSAAFVAVQITITAKHCKLV